MEAASPAEQIARLQAEAATLRRQNNALTEECRRLREATVAVVRSRVALACPGLLGQLH